MLNQNANTSGRAVVLTLAWAIKSRDKSYTSFTIAISAGVEDSFNASNTFNVSILDGYN